MSDAPAQDRIELDVKDFGPILEASLDLRPLTVFIGPSNTGKSWLATLIYALHRCFGDDAGPEHWHASPGALMFRDGEAREPLLEPLREEIKSFVQSAALKLFLGGNSGSARGVDLSGPLLDEARTLFGARGAMFGQEVARCLGVDDTGALSRRGSGAGARIALRRPLAGGLEPRDHELTLGVRGADFKGVVPDPFRISNDELNDVGEDFLKRVGRGVLQAIVSGDEESDEGSEFFNRSVVAILEKLVRDRVAGSLTLPAHYLPADRTGVLHAHHALVGGIIRNTPMAGRRHSAATPMLTGVLADFLRQIIEIDRTRVRDDDPVPELASQIEQAVLGGSVYVRRSGPLGSPDFMYRPKGWDDALRLTSASSMVSELAPVVLYLRHLAAPGSLLIVEEPESGLHPAMQVELVRRLAVVVGAGVRVIVTTHSEWILEALANIVRSSKLPETNRNHIAGEGFALRAEQVGAWLFQSDGRSEGAVVKEIRLDDSGLYPSGFDGVATALHNEWAEISSLLGESE